MPINPFLLERYFAKYEFKVKYLLSPSDCESLGMSELLSFASEESLELWNNLKLSYTESQGHEILREEISNLYAAVKPAHILIAAPEEGIYIAMQTLLDPGDEVVAVSPAYQSLYEIARSKSCAVKSWQFEIRNNSWHLDISKLEDLITDRTKLLVINFPHNPTGYLPGEDELKSMVDIARRKNIILFSDEMYRGLETESVKRLPSIADIYENGIALSGMSKSFALPGLRIGWLASRNRDFISRFLHYKDYVTICSSSPSEILALIALRAKERILERNNKIVNGNIKMASEFFSAHSDKFVWLPPAGGSTAFPKWLGKMSIEDLCGGLLESEEVMLVPGSMFEFPGNHFRLGLGRENFSEGMERFGEFLGEL